MTEKRQVLQQLKRDELVAAVDRFDLTVADRRVRDQLIEALASSGSPSLNEILGDLKRDRLKELCRALEMDDGGRVKAVLVERLAGERPASTGTEAAPAPTRAPGDLPERGAPAPGLEIAAPAEAPEEDPGPARPAAAPAAREAEDFVKPAPARFEPGPDRAPPEDYRRHGPGPHSPGPHAPGPRSQGPRSQGPRSQGPRSQGPRSQGPRSQGPRGPRSPGAPRSKPINIQDGYLFENLKENRPLVFVLETGKQIKGRIRRFDQYGLLVDTGTRQVLIYKHAISCITDLDPRSR